MKNKGIVILLILLSIIIVGVLVVDYQSGRPGRSEANPFALDIEEYKSVDPSLIHYNETKKFNPGFNTPAAIVIKNDTIYVTGDNQLRIISLAGALLAEIKLDFTPGVVEVIQGKIYLAAKNRIYVLGTDGSRLSDWEPLGDDSHITGMAANDESVFIADAGQRKVYNYTLSGELQNEIEGKAEEGALHGFIVPSPSFDLAINNDNELWVVNPGMHSIEHYSFDGRLRRHWSHSGVNHEGFSGCCNPGHFTFLNDGRFVTSEKGLVRIKTYRQSGEFEGVVAAPVKFANNGQAPDVAVDSNDNIYALDFNTKLIRVFSPVYRTAQEKQELSRLHD